MKSHDVTYTCLGVEIRGDQWGDSDTGRDVLLLHGGGQTRHSWGRAAQEIAAHGWRTTTIDLRGHGESSWASDGEYSLDAHADDLRHVIHHLGGRPVLVGASLGGLTALAAQGSDGELARALILVDVVPRTSIDGVRRIRDFMTAHLEGFESLDDAAEAVANYTGRARKPAIEGLKKNLRLESDGRWHWHWDPRMVSSQLDLDATPPIPVDDMLARARAIRVPVLIIRGGRSDVVTQEGIDELVDAIPHAKTVEVPGAGHMVAGDENTLFTAAVLSFLDALGP